MMTNLIVPPSTDFAIYGGASDCTSTQCVIHGACNILSLERSPSCITGTWVGHGRIRSGNVRLFAASCGLRDYFYCGVCGCCGIISLGHLRVVIVVIVLNG